MKAYEVEIGGLPHTLLLDDEDVKRYPKAKLVQEQRSRTRTSKPEAKPDKG